MDGWIVFGLSFGWLFARLVMAKTYVHGPKRMNTTDFGDPHFFSIEWMTMTFGEDIHGAQSVNSVSDPLTFI